MVLGSLRAVPKRLARELLVAGWKRGKEYDVIKGGLVKKDASKL